MTVSTELCEKELAWTGVETAFAPGFPVDQIADLKVFDVTSGAEAALTIGVHFSATRSDATKLPTVVPIALPAAPRTLRFRRETPATQARQFGENVKALIANFEDEHDRGAMRDAEGRRDVLKTRDMIEGVLRVEEGQTPPVMDVDALKGAVLGLGADGQFQALTASNIPGTVNASQIADSTAHGRALITSPSAAATLATLGVTADGKALIEGDLAAQQALLLDLASPAEAAAALDAAKLLTPATLVVGEATVATASTCAIGAAAARDVLLTGGVTVNAFDAAPAGLVRDCRAQDPFTLKNSAAIDCIGSANIAVLAGDRWTMRSKGAGDWIMTRYARASGAALRARSQTLFTLLRNPGGSPGGVVGPVAAAAWAFPGASPQASYMTLRCALLQGRKILLARWTVSWTPKFGADPDTTGVRLIHFDAGPTNITALATFERASPASAVTDTSDVTAAIQALLDGGADKLVGHQMHGDGTDGAIIYLSEIEIVWA